MDPSAQARSAMLFERGNALRRQGRNREAVEAYDQALALRTPYPEALNNRGNALRDLKRYEEALASFDRALAANPAYARAHNNRGNVLRDLGRLDEALKSFDGALSLNPDYAEALVNRGNVLRDLKRHDDACASYGAALSLRPDWPPALNNRGLALMDLDRHDDALKDFARAATARPDDADAHFHHGNALLRLNRHALALGDYERAIALAPRHAKAWNNRGNVLLFLRQPDAALASYGCALSLEPDNPEFLCNRGYALEALGRRREALADYTRASTLKPGYSDALYAAAQILRDSKQTDEAIARIETLMRYDPDYGAGALVDLKRTACDWNGIEALTAQCIAETREGKGVMPPFSFLAISDSLADQRRCAETFLRRTVPADAPPLWTGERYAHDKIRIAYVSADLHEHATAYLTVELFERHDKRKFEIVGVTWGRHERSPILRRLETALDRFLDVGDVNDRAVAERLGYTRHARPGIFAHRPAPVQANYLGFPGTTAAPFMDYLVADRIVLPREDECFYTEKIATLPDTYQPNDSKKAIADGGTRAEAGLPEDAFVFCSFNNNHKITPDVFDVWMRLLKAVEGSVLWLIEDNPAAARNLRKRAALGGVDETRVVFAPRVPMERHLGRQRLADLFLDTLPYNAHTTASDALWAGLPVVTCTGRTFAARVATSLLHAIGLPELATASLEEYEALALKLVRDRTALAAIREALAKNRLRYPLFDTARYCGHLEAAFTTMHERQQKGQAPASFDVQRLRPS
jgi:predicted O-linked N-acetylglucosamine transferase (SPINDLY family)